MVYITYNCPERFREMTFEELLRGDFNLANLSTGGHGATRTVICNKVPPRIMRITKVEQMILQLQAFNQQYESLRLTTPRSSLYNHFPIPKASGGLRLYFPHSDSYHIIPSSMISRTIPAPYLSFDSLIANL